MLILINICYSVTISRERGHQYVFNILQDQTAVDWGDVMTNKFKQNLCPESPAQSCTGSSASSARCKLS